MLQLALLVGALRPVPRQFLQRDAGAIVKPSQDSREYTYRTLSNGMGVLAVHDPTAVKAGVAVAVDAGSYQDGDKFPGLAHFCEHMMFLGTKAFPQQGDFDNFLSQHDGSSNAYTDQEMTVYFNEVSTAGYAGALERFSSFFVSPLFNRSMAVKEINAVDSEHKKNLPDAFRRTWEVMRGLANPKSPVSHFFTGDKSTLLTDEDGHEVVDALHSFHDTHYCAEREKVVMVANMSTTELHELAEKYFSAVPKDGCPAKEKSSVDPWEGRLGRMVHMGTRSSSAQLWVMVAVPPIKERYGAQPGSYLSYLFSDGQTGSLRSELKKADLATGLSSWLSDTSESGMLWIVVDLTDEGKHNYPKVLEALFGYMELVRERGVDEEAYGRIASLAKVHFDYQDPPGSVMNQVSSLAASVTQFGPEDVLTSGYVVTKPDKAVVEEYLQRLAPEYCNVGFVSPDFKTPAEEKARVDANINGAPSEIEREEAYNVDYLLQPVAGQLLELMNHPLQRNFTLNYTLPTGPGHVPAQFDVTKETSGEYPERLAAAQSEAWWKGIGVHKLPKAEIRVKIAFAEESATAELAALGMLHTDLVRDALEEDVDDLLSCGVGYSLGKDGDAFTLSFSGFDEHLEVLMEKVLAKIRKPAVSEEAFQRAREAKVQRFEDVTSSQVYQHASESYSVAMDTDAFSREEYVAHLRAASRESTEKVVGDALHNSRLTVLFVGNIPAKRAETMVSLLENALLEGSLDEKSEFTSKVVHPHQQQTVLSLHNPIPGDTNHATLNVYQWPAPPTIDERVKLLLLGSMLERRAFDELRTTRQLGYVVSAFTAPHGPIGEIRVIVQGTKATPDQVDGYIETMLANFAKDLAEMPVEELERRKAGIRVQLTKDDQTMSAEAGRYWHSIREKSYCFNRRELSVKALGDIKQSSDLAEFLTSLMDTKRTKVSVQMFGTMATNATDTVAFVDGSKLREQDPEFYPNDRLCPDKVVLLSDIPVIRSVVLA